MLARIAALGADRLLFALAVAALLIALGWGLDRVHGRAR